MEAPGHRSGGIQSVERAIAILKLFGESEPDLGVTELSRRLQLHKSTVSRLLSTLEAGGFVQQDPRNGRYRLGLQLATLAGLALTQYDLRDVARPLLQELAARAGETTTLSVLDEDVAVNIDQVLGSQPVKHIGLIGRRLPLHATAGGKPLLAHLPHDVQERLLRRPLERYTPRTIVDVASLRRDLEEALARGFAVGREEYEAELNAVGAAVRDHRGDVVASITISGPSYRVTEQRLPEMGALVKDTAERISLQLGFRPEAPVAEPQERAYRAPANTSRPAVPRVRPAAPSLAGRAPATQGSSRRASSLSAAALAGTGAVAGAAVKH